MFQQISGTAIGTKFAPPYSCIYMDRVKQSFLEIQELQPLLWRRYIEDTFFHLDSWKVAYILKRMISRITDLKWNLGFLKRISRVTYWERHEKD